jgi:hypothetical protein
LKTLRKLGKSAKAKKPVEKKAAGKDKAAKPKATQATKQDEESDKPEKDEGCAGPNSSD